MDRLISERLTVAAVYVLHVLCECGVCAVRAVRAESLCLKISRPLAATDRAGIRAAQTTCKSGVWPLFCARSAVRAPAESRAQHSHSTGTSAIAITITPFITLSVLIYREYRIA